MVANKIKALGSKYLQDTGGQFALWMSMIALPLMVGTTYVFDYRFAEAERSHIKSALDAAVLASVSDKTHTSGKRRDLAEHVFKAQYTGDVDLHLNVTVTRNSVEMSAKGTKPASLAKSVGSKGFRIHETSAAVLDFAPVSTPLKNAPSQDRVALPKGAKKADYAAALDLMSRSGELGSMDMAYSEADVLKALSQLGLSADASAINLNQLSAKEAKMAEHIARTVRTDTKSSKEKQRLLPSEAGPRLTE